MRWVDAIAPILQVRDTDVITIHSRSCIKSPAVLTCKSEQSNYDNVSRIKCSSAFVE